MSTGNYFDRIMERRSLGGFRSTLASSNDGSTYTSPLRRFVRKFLYVKVYQYTFYFKLKSCMTIFPTFMSQLTIHNII